MKIWQDNSDVYSLVLYAKFLRKNGSALAAQKILKQTLMNKKLGDKEDRGDIYA